MKLLWINTPKNKLIELYFDGRSDRDETIQPDEIINLIIDLNSLSLDDFYNIYFKDNLNG